jgi:predicted NUDIX family NTP pyrophosphohydrolase
MTTPFQYLVPYGIVCLMKKESAGLVMFRIREGTLEVFLAHPGGPFWKNKDAGAWSIPKGEVEEGEDVLATAKREFAEEIGVAPREPFYPLGSITQKSGKTVHAWAFEGDCDPNEIRCNTIEIEWPPKSGKKMTIPEIDRAEFFTLREASEKLNPAQVALLLPLEKVHPTEFLKSKNLPTLAQGSFF